MGFAGFFQVLPGFTYIGQDELGFYWVLLSITEFHGLLLGFTGFYRVLPIQMRRNQEFYLVSLALTGFLPKQIKMNSVFTGFLLSLTGFGLNG